MLCSFTHVATAGVRGFNSHTYADVANQCRPVNVGYRIDQYRLMRRLHDTFVRQLFYAMYDQCMIHH